MPSNPHPFDLIERAAVFEMGGEVGGAEAVVADFGGKTGGACAPTHHGVGVGLGQGGPRKALGPPPDGAEQWRDWRSLVPSM